MLLETFFSPTPWASGKEFLPALRLGIHLPGHKAHITHFAGDLNLSAKWFSHLHACQLCVRFPLLHIPKQPLKQAICLRFHQPDWCETEIQPCFDLYFPYVVKVESLFILSGHLCLSHLKCMALIFAWFLAGLDFRPHVYKSSWHILRTNSKPVLRVITVASNDTFKMMLWMIWKLYMYVSFPCELHCISF